MEISKYLFTNNPKDKKQKQSSQLSDVDSINNNKFSESDYRYLNINRGKSAALLLAVSAAGNSIYLDFWLYSSYK